MSNARELKERIESISETRKITNAMYLISSSRMKQAREKLARTEPFFFTMQAELEKILYNWPDVENRFFDLRAKIPADERKTGIVVITADKGLAGSYNHNVIKQADRLTETPGFHRLYILGEVGRHHYTGNRAGTEADVNFRYSVQNPTLQTARRIGRRIIDDFLSGELDEVYIIYTKMQNAMTETVEQIRLLPLCRTCFAGSAENYQGEVILNEENSSTYTGSSSFYPSPSSVIDSIAPSYITGIIYGCLVESYCSEHNARMMAMQNATDSADSMLADLNMTYNRVRQADITQELTEVVAGARAQQRK